MVDNSLYRLLKIKFLCSFELSFICSNIPDSMSCTEGKKFKKLTNSMAFAFYKPVSATFPKNILLAELSEGIKSM